MKANEVLGGVAVVGLLFPSTPEPPVLEMSSSTIMASCCHISRNHLSSSVVDSMLLVAVFAFVVVVVVVELVLSERMPNSFAITRAGT